MQCQIRQLDSALSFIDTTTSRDIITVSSTNRLQTAVLYYFTLRFFWYLKSSGVFADTGKVDLVLNLVERPSSGFSAGGGISSG